MNEFFDGPEGYEQKWLRQKLEGYYGKVIIRTQDTEKPTIYTSLDESNHILRENYKNETITEDLSHRYGSYTHTRLYQVKAI